MQPEKTWKVSDTTPRASSAMVGEVPRYWLPAVASSQWSGYSGDVPRCVSRQKMPWTMPCAVRTSQGKGGWGRVCKLDCKFTLDEPILGRSPLIYIQTLQGPASTAVQSKATPQGSAIVVMQQPEVLRSPFGSPAISSPCNLPPYVPTTLAYSTANHGASRGRASPWHTIRFLNQ